MTWRLPDTYHSAGSGQGTATLKFYEGRDILYANQPGKIRQLLATSAHARQHSPTADRQQRDRGASRFESTPALIGSAFILDRRIRVLLHVVRRQ